MWTITQNWQDLYKKAIQESLLSEEKFNTFRQNENYNCIVPNCIPYQEANLLYNTLIKYPEIMNKFSVIKKMDEIGSPELYLPWNTSPRNFKYMYTTARIKDKFGDKIKKIIEIGVGYGGLCFTMKQFFKLQGYKLVDIDCVEKLAKKFLNKLPLLDINEDEDIFFNPSLPYDLCISECAITELDDESIKKYYYEYLTNCDHLFIRTNFQNPYKLDWFISIIKENFNVIMEPDLPNEEIKTVLFGWKK